MKKIKFILCVSLLIMGHVVKGSESSEDDDPFYKNSLLPLVEKKIINLEKAEELNKEIDKILEDFKKSYKDEDEAGIKAGQDLFENFLQKMENYENSIPPL